MSLQDIDETKLSPKEKAILIKVRKHLKKSQEASDRVIKGVAEIKKLEKEALTHAKVAINESTNVRKLTKKIKSKKS